MRLVEVDNLIIELSALIDSVKELKKARKLNIPEYDNIKLILDKYTKDEFVSFDVVKKMAPLDIYEVFNLIGLSKKSIVEIEEDIKNEDFINGTVETINTYLTDYNQIMSNQDEIQNKRIKKYQSVIDALMDDKNIIDIGEVLSIMNTIAYPKDQIYKVLIELDNRNMDIQTNLKSKLIFNTKARITRLENIYYVDSLKYEINVILKEIHDKELTLELIPIYAIEIANKYNLDETLIRNILVTLISSEKIKDIDEISNVDRVLDYLIDDKDITLLKANNYIKKFKKLYEGDMTYKLKDNKEYLPLDMMEELNISYVEALEIKMLPLVKTLGETLDSLNKLSEYDSNYTETYNLVCDLVDLIDQMEIKRENEMVLNSIEKSELKQVA